MAIVYYRCSFGKILIFSNDCFEGIIIILLYYYYNPNLNKLTNITIVIKKIKTEEKKQKRGEKTMLKIIESLEKLEYEEAVIKQKKMIIKSKYDLKEAKLQCMSKEEWKEKGITNEAGRKSYILLQLKEINNTLQHYDSDLMWNNYSQNTLKRRYRYAEFAIEHNLPFPENNESIESIDDLLHECKKDCKECKE